MDVYENTAPVWESKDRMTPRGKLECVHDEDRLRHSELSMTEWLSTTCSLSEFFYCVTPESHVVGSVNNTHHVTVLS